MCRIFTPLTDRIAHTTPPAASRQFVPSLKLGMLVFVLYIALPTGTAPGKGLPKVV